MCTQSLSRVWLLAAPWTVAHQVPLSMGFSRKWVAVSFSRGSSWPRDGAHISCISCIGDWIFFSPLKPPKTNKILLPSTSTDVTLYVYKMLFYFLFSNNPHTICMMNIIIPILYIEGIEALWEVVCLNFFREQAFVSHPFSVICKVFF